RVLFRSGRGAGAAGGRAGRQPVACCRRRERLARPDGTAARAGRRQDPRRPPVSPRPEQKTPPSFLGGVFCLTLEELRSRLRPASIWVERLTRGRRPAPPYGRRRPRAGLRR